MGSHDPLGDGLVVCEVFAYDAFATGRGDLAVPNALRINDQPRAAAADAQASGFGAHGGNAEIFEAGFEDLPGREAVGGGAAVGADAEKNMTLRCIDVHFGEASGDDGVRHFFQKTIPKENGCE